MVLSSPKAVDSMPVSSASLFDTMLSAAVSDKATVTPETALHGQLYVN